MGGFSLAAGAAAAIAVLGISGRVYATPQESLAPPVGGPGAPAPGPAAADNVFNWTEIPQNQEVPIQRATFDQGGYQLYDTAGETIVVPFANQNLYVMQFARSTTGDMYLVNTGSTPILYVPPHAYLENAAVPGTRWYPFSHGWAPSTPVYIGIAPSWSLFIGMGWYPNMVWHGGYWGPRPWYPGFAFSPTPGLAIVIGGQSYYGWGGYHSYFIGHPAPYRLTITRPGIYHYALHGFSSHGNFAGAGGHPAFAGVAHGGLVGGAHVGGHVFAGVRGGGGANGSFGGHGSFGGAAHGASGHTFHGTRGGGGHGGGGDHGGGDHGGGDHGDHH
jgi:hypothetical protein